MMRVSKKTWITAAAAFLIVCRIAGAQELARQYKSPAKARSFSALGTVAPIGIGVLSAVSGNGAGSVILIGGGIILGPSAGYFYGGVGRRGWQGAAIRFCATGLATYSLEQSISASLRSDDDNAGDLWGLVFLGASVVLVADIIYDISAVNDHVRSRNEKLFGKGQSAISIYPEYFADSGASGIQLEITF
jgi:hypothetical protein